MMGICIEGLLVTYIVELANCVSIAQFLKSSDVAVDGNSCNYLDKRLPYSSYSRERATAATAADSQRGNNSLCK